MSGKAHGVKAGCFRKSGVIENELNTVGTKMDLLMRIKNSENGLQIYS